MSTVNTNPSTLFGGTWEQIKDTFVLAAGDTYEAGTTGGEATHTLTTNEMPSHTHTFTGTASSHTHSIGIQNTSNEETGYGLTQSAIFQNRVQIDGGGKNTNSTSVTPRGTNSSTGGGQAHNNMPPYLVAYMWKRTA